ncbi:hypothetical protein C3B60_15910 [Cryobacterium zongtaii]|nr:hypothetical protein C3B60_15910 [Cryobacterium zongtaii]
MEPRQRRILVAALVNAEAVRQGVSRERLARSTRIPLVKLEAKLHGDAPIDVDELEAIASALDVAVEAFLEDPRT